MLTKEEKEFITSRKKLVKLAYPLVLFLVFMWVLVYIAMFIFFPDVSNLGNFYHKNNPDRLTPVFFNLFMVVLMVLFVFMFVLIKIEEYYIRILDKFVKGAGPPDRD